MKSKQAKCVIPRDAKIAFVGNRPNEKEAVHGRAHYGRTEEIISKSMKQAGLFDHGPPGHHLAYSYYKSGQPTNRQVDDERDRLVRELESYKPRIIFALGSAPFYALTGDSSIKVSKVQGKAFTSEYFEWEHTIISIPHPATLVYRPQDYREYMQILTQAATLLKDNTAALSPPDSKFTVLDSEDKLTRMLTQLSETDGMELAADIETDGLSPIDNKILALGIYLPNWKTIIIPGEEVYTYRETISTFLSSTQHDFIWHNGKFDINFLREADIEARVDHDTILIEYLLDETSKSLSLKKLAARYLGADSYQDKIKGHLKGDDLEQGFENVPTDVLYEYLAQDCLYTYSIFKKIYPSIEKDPHLQRAYTKLMIPGTEMLSQVERNGILVDPKRLDEAEKELTVKKKNLRELLIDKAAPYWNPKQYMEDTGAKKKPTGFNPGSVKQLKWLLYESMRIKIPRGYNAGYDTKADTIEEIQTLIDKKASKFGESLLDYRKTQKLLSTYVIGSRKKIRRRDGRANGSYKLAGTATGRLSVDLFQQIPPVARRFYVATPGYKMIEVDYSGAELRVLAALSGDRAMKAIFIEGRDLHSEVAAELFSIPVGTETREQRLVAKTINFGIMYGRQAPSLAAAFGISVQEAARYINRWFSRFPEAHQFLADARARVRDPGYLVSPYGRYRRFPVVATVNLGSFENEACNFRMQSTASDLTLRSAIVLSKRLERARILNLVHDSILFEFVDEPEVINQGLQEVHKVMTKLPEIELRTDVKFEIEAKAGYSWGEMTDVDLSSLSR